MTLSVISVYFNTGQKWDTAALPARLHLFSAFLICVSALPLPSILLFQIPLLLVQFLTFILYVAGLKWIKANPTWNLLSAVEYIHFKYGDEMCGGSVLPVAIIQNIWTYQCSTASGQKLYIFCRHRASFTMSGIIMSSGDWMHFNIF